MGAAVKVQEDDLPAAVVEVGYNREIVPVVTSTAHLDKKVGVEHIGNDLLVVAVDGLEGIRTENRAVTAAVSLDSTCLVVAAQKDTVAVVVAAVLHLNTGVVKHAVVVVQQHHLEDTVHNDGAETSGRESRLQNDDETAILLEIYHDDEVVTLRQTIPS